MVKEGKCIHCGKTWPLNKALPENPHIVPRSCFEHLEEEERAGEMGLVHILIENLQDSLDSASKNAAQSRLAVAILAQELQGLKSFTVDNLKQMHDTLDRLSNIISELTLNTNDTLFGSSGFSDPRHITVDA